jgi:Rhodopirellula transposase DDE domain
MAEVLNRMGFRLRKVVKAKPQKKIAQTDAIFDNIEKKTMRRRRQRLTLDA